MEAEEPRPKKIQLTRNEIVSPMFIMTHLQSSHSLYHPQMILTMMTCLLARG